MVHNNVVCAVGMNDCRKEGGRPGRKEGRKGGEGGKKGEEGGREEREEREERKGEERGRVATVRQVRW